MLGRRLVLSTNKSSRNAVGRHVMGLSATLAFALFLALPAVSLAGSDLSGRVFRDYDADGVADSREVGIEGLTLTAYDASNASVGSGSTLADGTYTFGLSVPAGTDVRLELTGLPAFLRPGPFGSDSGTTVLFTQSGQTGLDIGLANPGQHCQTPAALGDLELVTGCYITGVQSTSAEDVLVSFDYLAGDTGPTADVDLPAPGHLATAQELGPVWGLAYQPASNSIFAGAFMKRHVSFLTDGATGVIYRVDLAGPTISAFLDLDTLFGAASAGTDPHPAGTDMVRDNNNDGADGGVDEAWDAVGKRAFGDLDLSDDQLTLYAVNLFDRSLYSFPLGSDPSNPTAPAAGAVTITSIPNPCSNADDGRPFGLGVKDGVVYVGGVCSAESTQSSVDLSAYVYTYTDGGGFSATPILSFAIDHGRGCAVVPGCAAADWNAWSPNFTFTATNFTREIIYPQPMLTDIDFDGDDLILGFRDRFGDQTGFDQLSTDASDNTLYRGDSAGSMVRACDVAGVLTVESNGSCGGVAGAGVGNGRGPGGGQFYPVSFPDHDHVALAGLANVPGFADLSFSMYDPIFDSNEFFDGGAGWNRHGDGDTERRFRIYSSNDTDPNTFAKGGGLGDQEALCEPAPLEIGNRVWEDDGNGVQDPGEAGIPGVVLRLFCGGSEVGMTTTDGDGQYLFNRANVTGGVPRQAACEVRIDGADPALGGRVPTLADAGTNDLHDSDGVEAAGTVVADLMTGLDGENDHTYDFGFTVPRQVGSIGDTVWCDGLEGTGNGIFDAGEGLPGVLVSLFEDTNCDDVADGAAIDSMTTTGDGQYLFPNLVIGSPGSPVCYVVRVDAADPDLGTCDLPITPIETRPDLDSDDPDDLDNDFGFEEPLGEGSLGDTVWCDGLKGTGNGIFDAGEGLPGVLVSLFEDANCDDVADGAAIDTRTTTGDGQYLFSGLDIGPPGSPVCYVVRVDAADPDLGTCDLPITPIETRPDLDSDDPDDLDNDFGFEEPCEDPDGDRVCNESCAADRDGDGDPDCSDFDPQGYLYCEDTGEILSGGQIEVSGPGTVTILEDGSTGRYAFLTDDTPGLYTLIVTPPPSFPVSDSCADQGVLDPTGLPDPLALGAGESLDSGVLTSASCEDNPYHLSFDLEAGDPLILNNNIPLQSCGQPTVEIPTASTWGLGLFAAVLVLSGALLLRRSP